MKDTVDNELKFGDVVAVTNTGGKLYLGFYIGASSTKYRIVLPRQNMFSIDIFESKLNSELTDWANSVYSTYCYYYDYQVIKLQGYANIKTHQIFIDHITKLEKKYLK